jgi:hypothetical protein
MLTLEIGRACRTRGTMLRSGEAVLKQVAEWLIAEGVPLKSGEIILQTTKEDLKKISGGQQTGLLHGNKIAG